MAKIDLNKSEDLKKFKEKINAILEERISIAETDETISSISSLPFGTIKNIFEGISDKLFESKKGKKLISKYIKAIKENKNVSKIYSIYEVIEKPKYVKDSSLFVKESINFGKNVDEKNLNEGILNVAKIVKDCIKEAKISNEELIKIINEKKNINESINYLLTTNINQTNLPKYTNVICDVRDYVNENMTEREIGEGISIADFMNQINESLNGLSYEEMSVVRDMTLCNLSNSGYQNLFEEYKGKCLESLENILSNDVTTDDRARLFHMKEQLEEKTYSEETIKEDLINFSNLNKLLENEK